MKTFIFAVLFSLNVFASEGLKSLPLQDSGRIKPYDTFAREVLELIYGKTKYEGRPAYEVVFTLLLQPAAWQDKQILEIRHSGLKKALQLPVEQRYFAPVEIYNNERLSLIFQELQVKNESKEKLDPYFQAIQRLQNQLFTFKELASGRLFKVVPPKEGETWLSIAELSEDQTEKFLSVTKAFVGVISAYTKNNNQEVSLAQNTLDEAVLKFEEFARGQNENLYPKVSTLKLEVHYNDFHPFKWAWMIYALAAFVLLIAWAWEKRLAYVFGWILVTAGLMLHTYGFIVRVILTGRAPVSNMYETVVWVAFGTLIFAAIIERIYKFKFVIFAGSLVAAFCLIVADAAPAILDASLQPLEPVLRSNFWLMVHVLIITISYSAFFLAFVLGDIGLIYYLKGEKENAAKIKLVSQAVYRSLQIGVALLGPGIILGGIWADYSWGRFWGWDPKETWALIALLGYVALLHGRIAGWLKDFGTIASAVVSFGLVIMAWYGVNYVLGAGLHSYGFGAGGVEYVAAFVAAHLVFVGFVTTLRQGRLKLEKDKLISKN